MNWKISQKNLSGEKAWIGKNMENIGERLRHIEEAYKRYTFNCDLRRKSES